MTLSFIRKDLILFEQNGFWNILETYWDRLEQLNPIQLFGWSWIFTQMISIKSTKGRSSDQRMTLSRKLSSTPSNNPVFVSVTLPFHGSKLRFYGNRTLGSAQKLKINRIESNYFSETLRDFSRSIFSWLILNWALYLNPNGIQSSKK